MRDLYSNQREEALRLKRGRIIIETAVILTAMAVMIASR